MARSSEVGVLEHGSTSMGRWFRQHRIRIAASIAAVEALLVVLHAISWWAALPIAVLVILFYLYAGRTSGSYTVRQVSWTAALSQVLVALVPIIITIATGVAIAIVAILAVVALIALFAERT